jgi:3-oxoacyl-[acyl-carrier protein] reductase
MANRSAPATTPTAIVTGGNSGIGEAIVHALAKRDFTVVVAGRRKEENERVARDAGPLGQGEVVTRTVDVAREEDCVRMIKEVSAATGRLDLLVNNAGIAEMKPLIDTSSDEFDRMMKTNLYSAYWCSREAFRVMAEQPQEGDFALRGQIINIASILGLEAWSDTALYATSKHGMVGLTRALADEGAARFIRVAAVCPAMVATPMTGQSGPEYIAPEDIARTVTYLLDLSSAAWPKEIAVPRRGAD